jgi:hypothetical protein
MLSEDQGIERGELGGILRQVSATQKGGIVGFDGARRSTLPASRRPAHPLRGCDVSQL